MLVALLVAWTFNAVDTRPANGQYWGGQYSGRRYYRPQQYYRAPQSYVPRGYYHPQQTFRAQPYQPVQPYQPAQPAPNSQTVPMQPAIGAQPVVAAPAGLGSTRQRTSSAPATATNTSKSATLKKRKPLAKVRVPGEFEPQRAIMLSVSDWMPHHFPILQQIVDATAGHVNLLILYNELEQLRSTAKTLSASNRSYSHVYFAPLELDTIWLRDFGPRVAELEDGWISIDFFYEGSRPRDDAFPQKWASAAGTRLRTVRWTVQGGNFISNGAGLGLTTNRIFQDNYIRFPNARPGFNVEVERRQMVTKDFKLCFNLDQLVVLEPLQQEATRHADMFVTMIDTNLALVAQVDQRRDPVNAAILDRNARRLSEVRVNEKPMEVHRIQVPPREGTYWSPYTNIIIANDLVLMPTFDSDDKAIAAAAVATYQRLLPSHTVKTIDMTSMKTLQGSLHCLSMNLPKRAPWPHLYYAYEDTIKGLRREETREPEIPTAPPE